MGTITKDEKQRGTRTLDQVVRMALKDIEAGLERYEQFLMWAQGGYSDFRMDLSREIKTVELDLTAWKAIEWPEDYVDWTLIGVRQNGRMYVFSNDEEIPLFFDKDDADVPEANVEFADDADFSEASDVTYNFRNYNSRGQDLGRLFGLAAKNNGVGYYRVNRERREIQINPIMHVTKVYLEYIADSHSPTKATIVPLYAVEMIKQYIHWKRIYFSKQSTEVAKREAERLYFNEFYRVVDRMDDTTIADIVEAAVDGYSGSPHF